MNLWEYDGQKVRISLKTGRVYEGVASDYTSALDNTGEMHEGEETICISNIEFSEKEIKTIELVD